MKLRLRVWLAGLAFCLFPTLAQAQHFLNQCSHAPIPICASLTPTEAEKLATANALAGIEYCVPENYCLKGGCEPAPDETSSEALNAAIDELASEEPLDVQQEVSSGEPVVEVITEVVETAEPAAELVAEIAEPTVEEIAEVAEVAEPAVEVVAEVAEVAESAAEEFVEVVAPAVEEIAEVVEVAEPAVEEVVEVAEVAEPAVEEIAEVEEVAEPAVEEVVEVEEVTEPAVEEIAEVEEVAEPVVEEVVEVAEVAQPAGEEIVEVVGPAVEEIVEVAEVAEPAVEEIAEVAEVAEPAVEEIAEVAEVVEVFEAPVIEIAEAAGPTEQVMEKIAEAAEAAETACEEVADVEEFFEAPVEAIADVEEPTQPAVELTEPQLARLMDAPIICTLRDPEEYLPYDLTATDALRWQIFADGIPRPSRNVQIPLRLDAEDVTAAVEQVAVDADAANELDSDAMDLTEIEPYASVVKVDSPVEEEAAAAPGLSIECVLDELVWQANDALRPQGWLRSNVQPEALGERLLSASQYATQQAESLLTQLARQMPVQPALVGPPAPMIAPAPVAAPMITPQDLVVLDQRDTPQVCCPLDDFSGEYTGHSVATAEAATDACSPAADAADIAEVSPEGLEAIDENLQAVLDFVRSIASPFQPRIANGGQETDTLAR